MANRALRLIGLLAGITASTPCSVSAGDFNIVLITIDTLRADHLACYGYKGVNTPNIDDLAAQGTKFVFAYSQVPFTLPSHASLFTSTYPTWNGVRDTTGPPLSRDELTLAETLKQNGYATAGFPAAFVLDKFFGLNKGFDYYYDNFPPRDASMGTGQERGLERQADEQLKIVFDWLNRNYERKFFIWLHLYDPHHPYDPPEPYRTLYRDHPYDGEIAYADSAVGKLIDYLASRNLSGRTILVLTSDHGEALGEHRESYHGYFIYDSTLRVPLIIVAPGLKDQTGEVSTRVNLLSVAPTILQLAGIRPPSGMQGRGLLALMIGKKEPEDPIYSESLFANLHFGWGPLYSLRAGRYKLIRSRKPELFDLETDPRERTNLFGEKRALASTLKQQLDEIITRYSRKLPARSTPKLTQEALNNLRALGYIGAPIEPTMQIPGDLADPKDKLDLYNLYLKAASEQGAGRLREAAATYQEMLASDPAPPVVHHQLGSVYFKLGNYPKAVESFKAALSRNPQSEASVLALARTYGEMGNLPEAVAGYERALSLNTDDPATLNNLAVIYMKMGSWHKATATLEQAIGNGSPLKESYYHLGVCYQRQNRLYEAAAELRKCLEIDSKFPAARYNLGTIYALQGKEEAAIEEFKMALEARPDFAESHFNLGSIYGRRGNLDDAVAEFKKAIQIQPKFAEAHFNLGTVYAKLGRLDDAIAEYKSAISIRPNFANAHRGLAIVYEEKGLNKEASAEMKALERLGVASGSKTGSTPTKADASHSSQEE